MNKKLIEMVSRVDFCFILACFATILAKTILLKKRIFADKLMLVDWCTILLSLSDFFYSIICNYDIFHP